MYVRNLVKMNNQWKVEYMGEMKNKDLQWKEQLV